MNDFINNMSQTQIYIVIGVLVFIFLLVGFFAFRSKINQEKDLNQLVDLPFDIKDLEKAIGGKDNIESVEGSMSKITLKLKDNGLVNQDDVVKLGCSGMVETSSGYTFIFGTISKSIAYELNKLLKG